MDLSVIIVNYKTAQLVIECINSVYAQTKQHSFEVIVVDNDSCDNSKDLILKAHPQVQWVDMGYNSGFARANNAGIKIAQGEYILLLNGDTVVLDAALDKTINLMKADATMAACGVQLLNTDGTTQISGAHTVKGGLNILLTIPYLGNVVRYWGYKLQSKVPSIQNVKETKVAVDWIIGAFIMVRKKVLDKAGLLDEDFFMYAEEIEWCSRLKKQGGLYLFSEPKVIHYGGGSSKSAFETDGWDNTYDVWTRKARQIMLSNLVRVRKEFGVFWYLTILFFYLIGIPIFCIGFLLQKIFNTKKLRFTWNNVAGYANNVLAMFTYFFRILSNKPFFYKLVRRSGL
ncbi:MAG: glycosyltransferase family 2 protein [Niabella sp.]